MNKADWMAVLMFAASGAANALFVVLLAILYKYFVP